MFTVLHFHFLSTIKTRCAEKMTYYYLLCLGCIAEPAQHPNKLQYPSLDRFLQITVQGKWGYRLRPQSFAKGYAAAWRTNHNEAMENLWPLSISKNVFFRACQTLDVSRQAVINDSLGTKQGVTQKGMVVWASPSLGDLTGKYDWIRSCLLLCIFSLQFFFKSAKIKLSYYFIIYNNSCFWKLACPII